MAKEIERERGVRPLEQRHSVQSWTVNLTDKPPEPWDACFLQGLGKWQRLGIKVDRTIESASIIFDCNEKSLRKVVAAIDDAISYANSEVAKLEVASENTDRKARRTQQ